MTSAIPWQYLESCSQTTLQNSIVAWLQESTALRKSLRAKRARLFQIQINIEIAQMLLTQRQKLAHLADARQQVLDFTEAAPLQIVRGENIRRRA